MADPPPAPRPDTPLNHGSSPAAPPLLPRVAAATLVLLAVVIVVIPAIGVIRAVIRSPADLLWSQAQAGFSITTLVNTVLYAIAIGLIATALAWPASAWLNAAARPAVRVRRLALVIAPLLLPNYLPYAGWGLLRGPNTLLGDWLARQDPSWSIVAGKVVALGGMALWSWPLAALVLAAGRERLGSGVRDLARLDALSAWRRGLVWLSVLRGSVITAILLVALVMSGSAIPLHVAQVPTYAIELWKAMQLSTNTAGLWLAAAPLLLVAGVAAMAVTRALTHPRAERPEAAAAAAPIGRMSRAAAMAVWVLAVLVPLGLFAWSLNSWRSVPMFWRISADGVAQSLRTGVSVGLSGVVVVLLTWAAVDSGRRAERRAASLALLLLAAAGLMPGVLIGAAINLTWPSSPGAVTAAHLARFGWLAAAAGWWLARQEPLEQRWLRLTDGGSWLVGWLAVAVRPRLAGIIGIGLAMAALSVHEMESTVFVLPPGMSNLAQQLLDYLHYARDEQLSAAAINLLGSGVVIAMVAGWLVARGVWTGGRAAPER